MRNRHGDSWRQGWAAGGLAVASAVALVSRYAVRPGHAAHAAHAAHAGHAGHAGHAATSRVACLAGAALLLCSAVPLHAQRAATATATAAASVAPLSATQFADVVAELSEPGGYFDTDNLISNERSYLHVMGVLDRLPVRGGAYVGVGPDQSFSYIARMRADVAFLIDVRRDNLLQHLLFKALFAQSRTRADYLSLLLGVPTPSTTVPWLTASIAELVAHIDSLPPGLVSRTTAQQAVQQELSALSVPLSPADRATIARLHGEFMRDGLSLRFTSTGRAPRPYYPTLRDLLLETDRTGRQASYLATEADFQFVKELERRNLVIPVVGDLAGATALRGIGAWLTAREQPVRVLYTSNAEDYVLRDGGFPQYLESVRTLPRAPNSVIVRSWFGGDQSHPHAVRGYFSVQLAQSFDAFLESTATATPWSYGALVFGPHLEP